METEDFRSRNNDYFKSTPTKLDISIEKLQQKYKWFKTEWANKTTRAMSKKRNHLCFSLIQPHTIFNKKMQCNVLLPHILLTRRPFYRLKYSVCPSVYTDGLIFTRKNWLIIAICCLYCRTNRLRRTNLLRPLMRLCINTANEL